MDWTARIPVNFAQSPTLSDRLWAFVGHWDIRHYVTADAYIDLGAGGLGFDVNVKMAPPGAKGCLGTIGRFCQFHPSAEIMAGGEHRNDLPVNVSLTLLPFHKLTGDAAPMHPSRPANIGNNVVISSGAKILAGVKVGDGAVIGAGAIVTKDVAPYTIVVENPARVVGQREPAPPWWNFSTSYFLANKDRIQDVARSPGPHEWRAERPRLAIKAWDKFEILGFVDGEAILPLSAVPAPVREYLTQAFTDTPGVQPYWMADPWPD